MIPVRLESAKHGQEGHVSKIGEQTKFVGRFALVCGTSLRL